MNEARRPQKPPTPSKPATSRADPATSPNPPPSTQREHARNRYRRKPHDPATLARFEEHAIFIAAQWEANRQRDLYFDRVCRNKWPAGP